MEADVLTFREAFSRSNELVLVRSIAPPVGASAKQHHLDGACSVSGTTWENDALNHVHGRAPALSLLLSSVAVSGLRYNLLCH